MEQYKKKTGFFRKFVGDRAFYKMVLAIAVPIMVQNGITNFVSLLDNIMIGRIGTEQMSGAAIVNQLLFVYNLCLFGAVSGAGIFTAQYFGQKDQEGVRQTFRYKLWMVTILTGIAAALLLCAGKPLISLYLEGDGGAAAIRATRDYGMQYMYIMLPGLPAFMLSQVYSSTLRECGETVTPMKAGITAVVVNLVLNYILIYGKFGFPALGVRGAAAATVLSRYVELAIVAGWTHRNPESNPFVKGLYSTVKVPLRLVKKFFLTGVPLLLNETLWGAGMAFLTQCYSVRGLNVVAALNIANTINNVFSVGFVALGESVAIVVGQILGSGDLKKARDTDNKMIAFAVACCTAVALVMLFVAPFFPMLYNTNGQARELAEHFIIVMAIVMPQNAFLNASYFTLRSGGKTVITFIFDCGFVWCVSVPIAYLLSRFTELPVIAVFALVQAGDLLKCALGFVLVKKGTWIQNLVSGG